MRDQSKDQVTVMVPMARATQDKLRAVHAQARKTDPRVDADYRRFAAILFSAAVTSIHAQVMPGPTIIDPGQTILPPTATTSGPRSGPSLPVPYVGRR